ncbi:hypothetical protein A9G24_01885 [Gilliamella sp. App6-5]|nr:hypothetical protein A9G24_01885 [Gilliamella apicola]
MTWRAVTHEGITATVTNVVPNDHWIPYEDRGQVVARVKLTGPEVRNQRFNPNRITAPRLPQRFELVGRDKNGYELVKYGFVLKKWFVSSGAVRRHYNEQSGWCSHLGGSMPGIKDLTNARCGVRGDNYFICIRAKLGRERVIINNGAAPLSEHGALQRQIGAGFFTEWGNVRSYAGAGFDGSSYWIGGSRSGEIWMPSVDSATGGVNQLHGDNFGSNEGLCSITRP